MSNNNSQRIISVLKSEIENYDTNAEYVYCVACGCSMSPSINDKDVVIAKKYDGNLTDGIYLFNIGDDFFIKRLSKNINQVECISDNPAFDKIVLRGQELDKLCIIARVVGSIRKF